MRFFAYAPCFRSAPIRLGKGAVWPIEVEQSPAFIVIDDHATTSNEGLE